MSTTAAVPPPVESPLPVDDALPRVLAFGDRFGREHTALAMHAALPLGVSPELVHLLRINFVPAAPRIAEADLLLSPLCRETGGGLYEMDTGVRDILLGELARAARYRRDAGGRPRIANVAEFLLAWTARALERTREPDALAHLHALHWVALAYARPQLAAEEIAATLARALERGDSLEALRVVRLTGALSTPLAASDTLVHYAAGIESLATGDADDAEFLFDLAGAGEGGAAVGNVVLPSMAAARPLWGAQGTLSAEEDRPPLDRRRFGGRSFDSEPPPPPPESPPHHAPPPEPPPTPLPAIVGMYKIVRELGRGMTGVVYEAWDVRADARVAVKLVYEPLSRDFPDPEFEAALDAVRSIYSPGIFPLFDSGRDEGRLYYAMPYAEGSLRQQLANAPLATDIAIRLTRRLADALAYAHSNRVIHGDIKPENVLFHDGEYDLADFAVLPVLKPAGALNITTPVGTPAYMAPEIWDAQQPTPASDVYAFGCLIHEVFTGEPPFGRTGGELRRRHRSETARALRSIRPDVPAVIESAVLRALEKDPQSRFPDAAAFAAALSEAGTATTEQQTGEVPAYAGGSAARPRAGASSEGWRVYISWTNDDGVPENNEFVEMFVSLLERAIQMRMPEWYQQVAFFDRLLTTGADWTHETAAALGSARCFLALLTPRYLTSSRGGREWAYFQDRVNRYRAATAPSPRGLILPVIRVPISAPVPEPVADLQVTQPEFPEAYTREGLRLMLHAQRGPHSPARLLIEALADQIMNATSRMDLPADPPEMASERLASIPSAFFGFAPPFTDSGFGSAGSAPAP